MKKRLFFGCMIVLVLIILTVSLPLEALAGTFLLGDVDSNGIINAKDYALVKRFIMTKITPTAAQFKAADIDGSGTITSKDYVAIKRHVLGTKLILQPGDSDEMVKKLRNASVGDYVTFGSYEQDGESSNGKEPIEWLVLDKQGTKLLLISRLGIDCQQYNTNNELVTWESCTLRSWLNSTFINNAFTANERKLIPVTVVKAEENPDYDTDPGNDTRDRVFLLSGSEAERYFGSNNERRCAPSYYARLNRVNVNLWGIKVDGVPTCSWWLRTPGDISYRAAYVMEGGAVYYSGADVVYGDASLGYLAVRPAIWVDTSN